MVANAALSVYSACIEFFFRLISRPVYVSVMMHDTKVKLVLSS
jgi:hypothetical protein